MWKLIHLPAFLLLFALPLLAQDYTLEELERMPSMTIYEAWTNREKAIKLVVESADIEEFILFTLTVGTAHIQWLDIATTEGIGNYFIKGGAPKLKHLSITDYSEYPTGSTEGLSVVAPGLQELILKNCPFLKVIDNNSTLPNLKTLILDGPGTKSLPEGLSLLCQLERLAITNLGLLRLPDSLNRLSRLTYLDISGNPDLDFNAEILKISTLKNLKTFICRKNPLFFGIHHILKMKSLEVLDLSSSFYSEMQFIRIGLQYDYLIETAPGLAKIRKLVLDNCSAICFQKIFYMAEVHFGASIEELSVSGTEYMAFQGRFHYLPALQTLSAKNCGIQKIPDELTALRHLKLADLSSNMIDSIPRNLLVKPGLTIEVSFNPIRNISEFPTENTTIRPVSKDSTLFSFMFQNNGTRFIIDKSVVEQYHLQQLNKQLKKYRNFSYVIIALSFLVIVFTLIWIRHLRKKYRFEKDVNLKLIRAREALIEAEKQAFRGSLLVGLRHDFKNMVYTVAGLTNLNSKDLDKLYRAYRENRLTPEQVEAFYTDSRDLYRTISEQTGTIEMLLSSFDRITAGTNQQEFTETNLTSYLQDLLFTLRGSLKKEGIRCEFQSDPETIILNTIPAYINQVIQNLFRNAIEHGFHVGHQQEKLIRINLSGGESSVIITFFNNGLSIPGENLPRIFDEYFSTKPGIKDFTSGIGLYHTRNMITKGLGGEIRCENTTDGVLFRIELPIHPETTYKNEDGTKTTSGRETRTN